MNRSRSWRRSQEARARSRARRIVALWYRNSDEDPFARPDADRWFGVVVSTHGRPCSGSCCFGRATRRLYPDRQRQVADISFREALAAA